MTDAPEGDESRRFDETLLAQSLIRMFGRPFVGLTVTADAAAGAARQLHPGNQLTEILGSDGELQLARIYGFSYEGHYYKLHVPSVFLVKGPGLEVSAGDSAISLATLGVEYKQETFAEGVRMWAWDRLDHSLRIDITSGFMEDILLNSEVAAPVDMMTGRSDLVGRSDVVGRSDIVGRSDVVSRSDLVARRRR